MLYGSRLTTPCLFRVVGILLCTHLWIAPTLAEDVTIGEEVIHQWKTYEDFAKSLQGTEWSTTSWDSGRVVKHRIIRRQNRQCVLFCLIEDDKPFERCKLANPWYAALIKRSKTNPSEVSLTEFSGDPQADFPGTIGSSFTIALPGFSPHFHVGQTSLSQFVADPHFKIKKITKKQEKDRQLVQVDYTHATNNPKTGTSRGAKDS